MTISILCLQSVVAVVLCSWGCSAWLFGDKGPIGPIDVKELEYHNDKEVDDLLEMLGGEQNYQFHQWKIKKHGHQHDGKVVHSHEKVPVDGDLEHLTIVGHVSGNYDNKKCSGPFEATVRVNLKFNQQSGLPATTTYKVDAQDSAKMQKLEGMSGEDEAELKKKLKSLGASWVLEKGPNSIEVEVTKVMGKKPPGGFAQFLKTLSFQGNHCKQLKFLVKEVVERHLPENVDITRDGYTKAEIKQIVKASIRHCKAQVDDPAQYEQTKQFFCGKMKFSKEMPREQQEQLAENVESFTKCVARVSLKMIGPDCGRLFWDYNIARKIEMEVCEMSGTKMTFTAIGRGINNGIGELFSDFWDGLTAKTIRKDTGLEPVKKTVMLVGNGVVSTSKLVLVAVAAYMIISNPLTIVAFADDEPLHLLLIPTLYLYNKFVRDKHIQLACRDTRPREFKQAAKFAMEELMANTDKWQDESIDLKMLEPLKVTWQINRGERAGTVNATFSGNYKGNQCKGEFEGRANLELEKNRESYEIARAAQPRVDLLQKSTALATVDGKSDVVPWTIARAMHGFENAIKLTIAHDNGKEITNFKDRKTCRVIKSNMETALIQKLYEKQSHELENGKLDASGIVNLVPTGYMREQVKDVVFAAVEYCSSRTSYLLGDTVQDYDMNVVKDYVCNHKSFPMNDSSDEAYVREIQKDGDQVMAFVQCVTKETLKRLGPGCGNVLEESLNLGKHVEIRVCSRSGKQIWFNKLKSFPKTIKSAIGAVTNFVWGKWKLKDMSMGSAIGTLIGAGLISLQIGFSIILLVLAIAFEAFMFLPFIGVVLGLHFVSELWEGLLRKNTAIACKAASFGEDLQEDKSNAIESTYKEQVLQLTHKG